MSPLAPKAVRVRTTDGWQDIAIQGSPGPAGGSTNLIQEIVLAAPGVITFSSIPQTYDSLEVLFALRGNQVGFATPKDLSIVRFNGYSGAGYNNQELNAFGTTIQAYGADNETFGRLGGMPDNVTGAGRYGVGRLTIPEYKGLGGFIQYCTQGPAGAPSYSRASVTGLVAESPSPRSRFPPIRRPTISRQARGRGCTESGRLRRRRQALSSITSRPASRSTLRTGPSGRTRTLSPLYSRHSHHSSLRCQAVLSMGRRSTSWPTPRMESSGTCATGRQV
jgi:hypothetical protein